MQLVIRKGTVGTAEATFGADIGVDGGLIVQIGGEVPPGDQEIDATGKFVFPGGVDIHTHLASFGSDETVDDFGSGSRAAAAGGVTTVCDFAYQRDGEGLQPALQRAHEDARRSLVDFTFHVVLRDPTPHAIGEIPGLVDSGHAGLKVFMSPGRFTTRIHDYYRAFRAAVGAGVLIAVHAEDEPTITCCTEQLHEFGRTGVEWFPASRPPLSEELAVLRAIGMAEVTGASLYFVHLSTRGALEAVAAAKSRGLSVHAETRPIYLYLTSEVFAGETAGRFIGHPPLRGKDDVEAVWAGLSSGLISTVCSDHIPYSLATKTDPRHTFDTVPPGMANLETQLPMLYSEGVRKGRISVNRMVELLSTNPARLAGMAPRKGTIAPGSDADLVVFDPELTKTVRASETLSAADYDIFEGWEVTGWPITTVSRGEVIFDGGVISGREGRGRFVRRARFTRS